VVAVSLKKKSDGARIVETEKHGLVRTIVLRPDRLKTVDWTIRYH